MRSNRTARKWPGLLVPAIVLLSGGRAAWAYVEAPFTLGQVLEQSSNVLVMRVEKLDKEKNLIVYRKVRDLKGTHKDDEIRHDIGRRGFHPREWQTIMAWAKVGDLAVFFHNGSAGETCIDGYWYQVYAGNWWAMSHGEPYLLRSFTGRPEKLVAAVSTMLTGKEVIVPCMVDGDKNALQLRKSRIQRMKASLKLQDYNPTRDFAGWGAEEFRAISDMPGFSHYGALTRVDPDAVGIAPADFDGDGKPDLCLFGTGRLVLLQNGGAAFNEVPLPVEGGARAAAWADCNGDGRPDLLLAAPAGPRLLLNEKAGFKDITPSLPRQDYYHPMAAAWIDYDGDGKPDILLADGFRGLRLYRNLGFDQAAQGTLTMGPWYYAGPFDNTDHRGFDTVYPPESHIDLSKEYTGKNNEKVVWREGKFQDGTVNNLALFKPECNVASAVYLYREISVGGPAELPVSLGSDDTLTVWLNGKRLLAENVYRNCAPDQALLTLHLKPGKNALLLKICQGEANMAFYFAPKAPAVITPQVFQDVSDKVGLGVDGLAGKAKGDHLAVADVNGDGRPDFLYSALTGVLAINTPGGFVQAKDCGIAYQPGGIAPAFGDFNGDKHLDLFVPQQGRCKLFQNDGKGKFTDVTARSGALAAPIGYPTCAVWYDFNKQGRLDLLVGCLRGQNRYFRNDGGVFTDAGDEIGFYQRIFNTRSLCVLDLNKDGVPDVVLNNEGQESAVLMGDPARIQVGAGER